MYLGTFQKRRVHASHYKDHQQFGYLVGCVHSNHCCKGPSPTEAIILEQGAVCLVLSGLQFAST